MASGRKGDRLAEGPFVVLMPGRTMVSHREVIPVATGEADGSGYRVSGCERIPGMRQYHRVCGRQLIERKVPIVTVDYVGRCSGLLQVIIVRSAEINSA